MGSRKKPPPSPIANRKLVSLDSPLAAADVARFFEPLMKGAASGQSDFERAVDPVERSARSILEYHGLKPDAVVADDQYPGPTWFAAEILSRVRFVRDLLQTDAQAAVVEALFLGALISKAEDHLQHGMDAAYGAQLRQNWRRGHEERYGSLQEKEERWRQQYDSFERHRAHGASVMEAMKRAAVECGCSVSTISNARKWFERKTAEPLAGPCTYESG